ncbi:MAG: phosphatidylglycerophosphatase A [Rhodobacteraceae bacterium]|nr:phosphatidylglycerophosphatase A [Paracoccaceae bacterium]
MKQIARLIATVGGLGHLKPAPGTWASAAALPLAWALHTWGGFPLLAIATVLAAVGGFWATRVVLGTDRHMDPPEVVIDEVAGQWLALWAISLPAWLHGLDITVLWPGWVSSFLLFRLFDIWKPGPVGWADRSGGPLGVMLDDLIAGLFAAIGTVVLAGLAHGVLGL